MSSGEVVKKRESLKKQNLNVSEDSIVRLNAENLKKMRLAKAYTLDRLGELSGLSTSYISRLEASARRMNAQILNRLARALGCSPISFFSQECEVEFQSEAGHKKNVPIYRVIPAGTQVQENTYSIIFLTDPVDYTFGIPKFVAKEGVFAIYAINDCYYPRFNVGSLLYFDSSFEKKNGSLKGKKGSFALIVDTDNCLFMGEIVNSTEEETQLNVPLKKNSNEFKIFTFKKDRIKKFSPLIAVIEP